MKIILNTDKMKSYDIEEVIELLVELFNRRNDNYELSVNQVPYR